MLPRALTVCIAALNLGSCELHVDLAPRPLGGPNPAIATSFHWSLVEPPKPHDGPERLYDNGCCVRTTARRKSHTITAVRPCQCVSATRHLYSTTPQASRARALSRRRGKRTCDPIDDVSFVVYTCFFLRGSGTAGGLYLTAVEVDPRKVGRS